MDKNNLTSLPDLDKENINNSKNQNASFSKDADLSNLISEGLKDLEEIPEIKEDLSENILHKENIREIENDYAPERTIEESTIVQPIEKLEYQENILKKEEPVEEKDDLSEEPIRQEDNYKTQTFEKPYIAPEKLTELKPKEGYHITDQEIVSEEITEKSIEKEEKKIGKKILIFFGFLIFIIVFVYLFLNFPAISAKLSFYFKKKTGIKPAVETIIDESFNDELLFLSTVVYYPSPPKKEVNLEKLENIDESKLPTKQKLGIIELNNDTIFIPKINVTSPIVWDSPVDEATMLNNLKFGVVHYKGTAKPGEKSPDSDGYGNVFISGHSSYYWWDDGKYKTVFANLDSIEVGDEIAVGYNDKVFIYKVFEKVVVNPDDLGVVKQDTDKHRLSLMTCVPIGTNINRLIVRASLIAIGK